MSDTCPGANGNRQEDHLSDCVTPRTPLILLLGQTIVLVPCNELDNQMIIIVRYSELHLSVAHICLRMAGIPSSRTSMVMVPIDADEHRVVPDHAHERVRQDLPFIT